MKKLLFTFIILFSFSAFAEELPAPKPVKEEVVAKDAESLPLVCETYQQTAELDFDTSKNKTGGETHESKILLERAQKIIPEYEKKTAEGWSFTSQKTKCTQGRGDKGGKLSCTGDYKFCPKDVL